MVNPYRSPTESGDSPIVPKPKFWQRSAVLLIGMVALNFARLLVTWHAYHGDGYEQIGFPLVVFERGGFSYSETIYWKRFVVNGLLAIIVAFWGAHVLRDGWYAAFRRIQTWGQDVT